MENIENRTRDKELSLFGIRKGDKIRFTRSGKEYDVINVTVSRILVANGREKFSIPETQMRKQLNKKEIEVLVNVM